jgi:hypothetical protein
MMWIFHRWFCCYFYLLNVFESFVEFKCFDENKFVIIFFVHIAFNMTPVTALRFLAEIETLDGNMRCF